MPHSAHACAHTHHSTACPLHTRGCTHAHYKPCGTCLFIPCSWARSGIIHTHVHTPTQMRAVCACGRATTHMQLRPCNHAHGTRPCNHAPTPSHIAAYDGAHRRGNIPLVQAHIPCTHTRRTQNACHLHLHTHTHTVIHTRTHYTSYKQCPHHSCHPPCSYAYLVIGKGRANRGDKVPT